MGTKEAVDAMTSLSAEFDNIGSHLGFAVRAGLIANQHCPTLKKLLQSRPGSFLTVELQPTDRESREDLKACSSSLPRDRLLFLMPKDKEREEKEQRIPEPRTAVTGGAGQASVAFFPLTLLVLR